MPEAALLLAPQYQQVVDYLEQYMQKLLDVSADFKTGNYDLLSTEMDSVAKEVLTASSQAKSAMEVHSRATYEYADTPPAYHFFNRPCGRYRTFKLTWPVKIARPSRPAKQLYTSSLNLQVAKDVLLTQTRIYEGQELQG